MLRGLTSMRFTNVVQDSEERVSLHHTDLVRSPLDQLKTACYAECSLLAFFFFEFPSLFIDLVKFSFNLSVWASM